MEKSIQVGNIVIRRSNVLEKGEKEQISLLVSVCNRADGTCNELFLTNEFNVYPEMPCFCLLYTSNYWPCEVLGLPECHLPMMDLLTELADAGKQTAKEYYHLIFYRKVCFSGESKITCTRSNTLRAGNNRYRLD